MDENNLSDNMAQITEALNRNTEMLNSLLAFNMAMVPKDQLAKMNLENNIKGQAQAFDVLGDATRGYTRVQKDAYDSALKYQQAMNNFKAGLDHGQAAVESFTSKIYSGERSYSKYESTLKSVADASTNVLNNFGALGKTLGFITQGIAKVGNAYLEQADNVLKASDQLSKIGNAGAMTAEELLKTAHQSGITSKNLDLLVKPLQNMGTSLTSLGGTASEGIKSFASLTKITNQQREGFQRLGVSQGELMQNQADYIKLQAMSGRSLTNEMKDRGALQRASLEYTENLLVLSNLSGQDAESIKKKQQEAARAIEAQVAQIQLENKARQLDKAGREDEAKLIRKEAEGRRDAIKILAATGDQGLTKGVREYLSTGTMMTDEGQALARLGLDKELQKLKAGIAAGGDAQKLTAQFQDKYNQAIVKAVDQVGFSASRSADVAKSFGISEESLENAIKQRDRNLEKELEVSRKRIKEAQKPGKDPARDAAAAMTTAEIEAAKNLDELVLKGNPLVKGFDATTVAVGLLETAAVGAAMALAAFTGAQILKAGAIGKATGIGGIGAAARAAPAATSAAASVAPGFVKSASGLLVPASAAAPVAPAATGAASSLSSSMSALSKTLGSVGKVLGSTAGTAGLGAVMGGYQAYSGYQDAAKELKEGKITEEEANKKKGGALGEGAGTTSGTVIGAAIGTAILPGIGTAIGGALGGWLGGKGGQLLGEKLGEKVSTLDTAKSDLAEKEKEIADAKTKQDEALAAQKTATTAEEKAAADRGVKYWAEKLKELEVDKAAKEKIKNKEEELQKKQEKTKEAEAKKEEAIQKAKQKIVEAEAKLAKSMETASFAQKMGFGREADQKKASSELDKAKAELGKMSNRPAASFESTTKEKDTSTSGDGSYTQISANIESMAADRRKLVERGPKTNSVEDAMSWKKAVRELDDVIDKEKIKLEAIPKAAEGGIFSGPKSGYPVELHGNEAVIPLSSKTALPDIFENKSNDEDLTDSKEEKENSEAFSKSLKDSDAILKKLTGTFSKWNKEIEDQLELKEEETEKIEDFVEGTSGVTGGFKNAFFDLTNFTKQLKVATGQIGSGSSTSAGGGSTGGGSTGGGVFSNMGARLSAGAQPTATTGEQQTKFLAELKKQGITDTGSVANLMSQVQSESGFRSRSEDVGKYSAQTLFRLYGPGSGNKVRFRSMEEAQSVVQQGPEAVGNLIYGGRMGNAADEGYKYRGRGLIQLTGKDNYEKYGKLIGVDLVKDPDLANDPDIAAKLAAVYFKEKQSRGVDLGNIEQVGKSVGYAGGRAETQKRAQLAQAYSSKLQSGEIPQAAMGGIFDGPMTGYPVEHHGREITAPLDANSILEKLATTPATQTAENATTTTSTITGTDINDRIIEMLTDKFDVMIAKLDDMISELSESNNTQSDLLKYSKI